MPEKEGVPAIGFLKRTWAEIDREALAQNFKNIRRHVGESCKIMAVVKADGYGHGAAEVSRVFSKEGADWFGVSNLDEAVELRRAGITKPILVLGYTPPENADILAKEKISQTVFSAEYAAALSQNCEKIAAVVDCHIKLDTGMGRLGFLCDGENEAKTVDEVVGAARLPGLAITGVFTHFASADEPEADDYTQDQFDRFLRTVATLEQKGVTFAIKHCANSAATLRFKQMHLDMVRPGIILYGVDPTPACRGIMPMVAAMTLKTAVAMVKELPAGAKISYGRTYIAPKKQKIATVPVGYADGYRRNHSNHAKMAVGDKLAPVVGTVCMDQLMLDVTGIEGIKPGDEVTVFGPAGCPVTIWDLAAEENSIPYEVMCLVGKRVPRRYI